MCFQISKESKSQTTSWIRRRKLHWIFLLNGIIQVLHIKRQISCTFFRSMLNYIEIFPLKEFCFFFWRIFRTHKFWFSLLNKHFSLKNCWKIYLIDFKLCSKWMQNTSTSKWNQISSRRMKTIKTKNKTNFLSFFNFTN